MQLTYVSQEIVESIGYSPGIVKAVRDYDPDQDVVALVHLADETVRVVEMGFERDGGGKPLN